MTRITTVTEARSLSDIGPDWKIVARDGDGGWSYCGALNHNAVHKLAHDEDPPRISIVTGRDLAGMLALYARVMPVVAEKRKRA